MKTLEKQVDKMVVSIDPVVFSLINDKLHILLVYRDKNDEVHPDTWTLPGGVVKVDDQSLESAIERVLETKTGVKVNYSEQLGSTGGAIDPRSVWTISISYMALVDPQQTIKNAKWVDLDLMNDYYLGFKHHYDIIEKAKDRLTNKVNYSTLPIHFLGEKLTLPKLQKVYEVLLGEKIKDKSTFREKMLKTGLFIQTDDKLHEGAHRPSWIYKVEKQDIHHFSKNII